MAINHPANETYELVNLNEEQTEPTTKGLFSLPLELRLEIYNLALDDEYEIYETGLPALLRTRLQITREFYQLCKLRVVLVHQRNMGFFARYWTKPSPSLRRYKKGDLKTYRVWQHYERILKHSNTIPRRDPFVNVKVEQWCTHAAVYPEKAVRSHGKCRNCRIRKRVLIQLFCICFLVLTVLAMVLCSVLILVMQTVELQREGSWEYPVVRVLGGDNPYTIMLTH